jgi:Family of unknown function (DUF6399)/IclR helix-turn-helix domain
MKSTIGERVQKVFQAISSEGTQTLRDIAQRLGYSKSSVHRHQQTLARRNQYPESEFWESEAGTKWLHRFVIASIFIFCFQRGVGCESLSQYFQLLHLDNHVGVSVASLRKIRSQMETQVLKYQQSQQATLADSVRPIDVAASLDETFFDQVILVMLDLPSGFIFVEELADNYRYTTWQQQTQRVLKQFGLTVRYCVSDRAKGLIKLALQDFHCPSVADLFHALSDLSKGLGREIAQRLSRVNRRLNKLKDSPETETLKQHLQAESQSLQTAQVQYQDCVHQLTLAVHPFHLHQNTKQTSAQVEVQLSHHLTVLKTLKKTHHLADQKDCLTKVTGQIPDLSACIDLWWEWVQHHLNDHPERPTQEWVQTIVLPLLYWEQQTQRTQNPTLKALYQQALQQAQITYKNHPLTQSQSPEHLEKWHAWATWMVTKFQRASSAVEGRNGYLSQLHHNHRGLSARRLAVMTTLHNFYLKRPDGSTAAERLFGQSSPDLFESIVQQMPPLPQARRRKISSKAQTFTLPTVPA